MAIGIAHLNLRPAEFYEMRVATFFNALNVWYRKEREDQRFIAELFRMQTTDLLNIQIKRSNRIKHGELWKFPWDDEGYDEKPLTDDEIRKHNDEILKRFKNG